MKKWSLIFYSLIIVGFSGQSLIANTWSLIHLKLPQYFITPVLLSGTLLLYDRPMFFEGRQIEVTEKDQTAPEILEYDLTAGHFHSYVERRLFRMATSEFPCGGSREAAFEKLFCQNTLSILKNKKIESVTVRFLPYMTQGQERAFEHRCRHDQ